MPGNNGSDGFNPFEGPLVSTIGQTNIASEMIGYDDEIKALFLTLTYFMDEEEAMDYADILHKCEESHMYQQKKRWLYRIAAKCSVKGYRSHQIVNVLTGIQAIMDKDKDKREKANDSASSNRAIKTPNA